MTDLDARVAALIGIFDAHGKTFDFRSRVDMVAAIRAELQKPALHEPVTRAEAQKAFSVYADYRNGVEQSMQAALESFLQGRAKPAQEEITDAESKKWLLRSVKAEALLRRVHRLMPIFEKGMGQLAFTAETGGEVYAEMRAIQLELSGHTEESWTEAAIRASKGEKT